MASMSLRGRRVALLATHGAEHAELTGMKLWLERHGAAVEVVAPLTPGACLETFHDRRPAGAVSVTRDLTQTRPGDYHALGLPGGVLSIEALRILPGALELVADFFFTNKPVFTLGHGPQLLISAGVAEGRTFAAPKAIQIDLRNAGAHVRLESTAVDGCLVSGRDAAAMPALKKAWKRAMAPGAAEVRAS
jgi:protease I